MVTKEDIERAIVQGEQENALFADKSRLDGFVRQGTPVSREPKVGELAKAIAGGLKKGYAPPLVFVYGRTGSGKSTVVKFVCEHLPLAYKIVNLRQARSVFGCASLILEELGGEPVKSPHDTEMAVDRMAQAIEALYAGGMLVLVLDEFDVLLQDRRGSDFVIKEITPDRETAVSHAKHL